MLSEIEQMIEYEQQYSNYVSEMKKYSDVEKIKEFSELRKIDIEELIKCDIFYVSTNAQMVLQEYFNYLEQFGIISNTNHKPIFQGRWVIPIKDSNGLVQNMVGYSPDANERYIYGTGRYYMRGDTLWGLENLELAYELGYAIVVEGITDAIHIRSLGFRNTFATCGTRPSDLNIKKLNRCKYGILRIPDRDVAGFRTKSHWKTFRYITLNTKVKYKDSDEMIRASKEEEELFKMHVEMCIGWLLEKEHKGLQCETLEDTIL